MLPDRLGTPAVQLGTYKTHIFGHYMFVKMATGFPAVADTGRNGHDIF